MKNITVKEVMTVNPLMINPTQTVKEAAKIMKENDIGVLPVGIATKVFGILTDRDIVIRLVAEGKDALKTRVQDIMSKQVFMCEEGDSLEIAAEHMRKHDVSRLIVCDANLVTGIVTLACLLRNNGDRRAGDKVLHHLLGRKKPQRKPKMGTAGAGSESCDAFDEAL